VLILLLVLDRRAENARQNEDGTLRTRIGWLGGRDRRGTRGPLVPELLGPNKIFAASFD
jgi:hypothetical protein